MKKWKRKLAVLLSAMLLVSNLPVTVLAGEMIGGSPPDEVIYNLGTMEVTVGSDAEKAAAATGSYDLFDEYGNYTLELEPDAFFPYEVQFTYGNDTWSEWFMDVEDTVEVGGHTFSVESPVSDPDAVTGLSFEVGGKTVVAWPEAKTFTTSPPISLMSLLPLEEVQLTVDLTALTPPELAMPLDVKATFSSHGAGDLSTAQVLCKEQYGDNYELLQDGEMYLPVNSWSHSLELEFIVGKADQLEQTNKRYLVTFDYTRFYDWLTVSVLNESGDEIVPDVEDSYFNLHSNNNGYNYAPSGYLDIPTHYDGTYSLRMTYEVSGDTTIRVKYTDVVGGYDNADITDQIWGSRGTGFPMYEIGYGTTTIEVYDSPACTNLIGSLDVRINIDSPDEYQLTAPNNSYNTTGYKSYRENDLGVMTNVITFSIPENRFVSGEWKFSIDSGGGVPGYVVKAVEGYYEDYNDPAVAALTDIQEQLYGDGCAADYFTEDTAFTIFTSTESGDIIADCFYVQAETYSSASAPSPLVVEFTGISGQGSDTVYAVKREHDTYVVDGFQTLLTTADVDLTDLQLTFSADSGITLYDSKDQVQSGGVTTGHDFSRGPVKFTALEGETEVKNFWVTVVKKQADGTLLINGGNDPENPPDETNSYPVYERQVFLDGYYGNEHDILLANVGGTDLTGLRVELTSSGAAALELDDYWTIQDNSTLPAFTSAALGDDTPNGELSNLAKLRVRAQDDASGEVDSMLTIYSGDSILAKIHMTGVAGDPSISDTEIPQAVQYVPYEVVIQNTNRYDWNRVSYSYFGKLPAGVDLQSNGRLYGVPTERGTFTFTVLMENSYTGFSDSYQTFTLVVNEPTDAAVEAQNDPGYGIETYVPKTMTTYEDQVFVSEGEFTTFVGFWLDGVRLTETQDYEAESGSTKITIRAQTFQNVGPGTHTIAAEFRTDSENSANSTLRRTAQNYTVGTGQSSTNPNVGGNSGNNSDSGGSPAYTITTEQTAGGTITTSHKAVTNGNTVTITATPDAGYMLDELVVKDRNGTRITITKIKENQYTFQMPVGSVTIEAAFTLKYVDDPVSGLPFLDVGISDWFASYVTDVYNRGLMVGTSEITFSPEVVTSRAMMVTILYNLEGKPATDGTYFSDVALNQFYTAPAAWASENNIVVGYGDGNFGPNHPITREQAIMILMRYCAYKGIDTSRRADLSQFTDSNQISAEAVDAMSWAYAEGLINGKSEEIMDPKGQSTRAEISAIISRFCQKFVSSEDTAV